VEFVLPVRAGWLESPTFALKNCSTEMFEFSLTAIFEVVAAGGLLECLESVISSLRSVRLQVPLFSPVV